MTMMTKTDNAQLYVVVGVNTPLVRFITGSLDGVRAFMARRYRSSRGNWRLFVVPTSDHVAAEIAVGFALTTNYRSAAHRLLRRRYGMHTIEARAFVARARALPVEEIELCE